MTTRDTSQGRRAAAAAAAATRSRVVGAAAAPASGPGFVARAKNAALGRLGVLERIQAKQTETATRAVAVRAARIVARLSVSARAHAASLSRERVCAASRGDSCGARGRSATGSGAASPDRGGRRHWCRESRAATVRRR